MGTEQFWKIHWQIAVWHNIIGGVGMLFLGNLLYARDGLPDPEPGVNYLRWMLLVLVFAVAYYLISRDLYHSDSLVIVGILGKLASASADFYYLTFRSGVPRIFWITVGTDYMFVVTFILFLRFARAQRAKQQSPQLNQFPSVAAG